MILPMSPICLAKPETNAFSVFGLGLGRRVGEHRVDLRARSPARDRDRDTVNTYQPT